MMPAATLPAPCTLPLPTPAAPLPGLPGTPTPPAAGLSNQPAHAFVQATRVLAVGSLVGLIALGLAWELWLAPTGSRFMAFKVLPLLLPLAGLLKHRLYTYRWVSLLVWLYFAEGMVRATGLPPGAVRGTTEWLAWGQVLLCTVLFIACAAHVRWRLKHPLPAAADPS